MATSGNNHVTEAPKSLFLKSSRNVLQARVHALNEGLYTRGYILQTRHRDHHDIVTRKIYGSEFVMLLCNKPSNKYLNDTHECTNMREFVALVVSCALCSCLSQCRADFFFLGDWQLKSSSKLEYRYLGQGLSVQSVAFQMQ